PPRLVALAGPPLAGRDWSSRYSRWFYLDRMKKQRRVEIGASLSDDLLAELIAQDARLHFLHAAGFQLGELERPEGNADQPVHLQAEMPQHVAHLAVFALADAEGEPDIRALLAVERRLDGTVMDAVDADAAGEVVERGLCHPAKGAHAIAPQPARLRQFEDARETAVIGEEQQALGADVEAADADQPWQRLRQRSEDRRPPLRIGMRGDQPARLVVKEQPGALASRQRLAVDFDAVGRADVERRRGDPRAIDGDAAGGDAGFRLAPRSKPRACHHLGDPLAGFFLGGLVCHH